MKEFIKIHSRDNVVIALKNFSIGDVIEVDGKRIIIISDVEKGHKIATEDIATGTDIIKYGYPIGHAIADIKTGEHVHVQNVKTNLRDVFDYSYNPQLQESLPHPFRNLTFDGYRNGIAEQIIREFKAEENPDDIDGIEVFKHSYGCSQLGDDHENTRQILGDIAKHPNAGGVLVLGLGCENNKIDEFEASLGDIDRSRIKFLSSQSTSDEVEDSKALLKQIYEEVRKDKREPVPVSELKVGLKCGGSDGLSGITAIFQIG
jgi:altronate hydrolase